MLNLSVVSDEETASTCYEVAQQRAENLDCLGVRYVTELCVGPSMPILDRAYRDRDMWMWGNDIDPRWSKIHEPIYGGRWIEGDALQVSWIGHAVVFAPPLSRGCTGRREDALRISQVQPYYSDFLREWVDRGPYPRVAVMVLPARSLSTSRDRAEYHALLTQAARFGTVDALPLVAGRRKIRKYVDVYVTRPEQYSF